MQKTELESETERVRNGQNSRELRTICYSTLDSLLQYPSPLVVQKSEIKLSGNSSVHSLQTTARQSGLGGWTIHKYGH
jgi:hypothetical protein